MEENSESYWRDKYYALRAQMTELSVVKTLPAVLAESSKMDISTYMALAIVDAIVEEVSRFVEVSRVPDAGGALTLRGSLVVLKRKGGACEKDASTQEDAGKE